MAEPMVVITKPTVAITITSSLSSASIEKTFNKDLQIIAFKERLEMMVGAAAGEMTLEVYNKENQLVCTLDNNQALLGSYHIDDGMRIHVVSNSALPGALDDLSQVEKFELADEEYDKKTDSVRNFLRKNKLGKFEEISPEEQQKRDEEEKKKKEEEKALADSITVGNRCQVTTKGQPTRRGQVMYVGETEFQTGYWVGIKLDEPMGKNDGSVKGKRYFECQPKYGAFARPHQVAVGDYPEEDMDLDEI